jgi:hypothetical protein
MKDTAISNFEIMINTIIKGGKADHPYITFLRDGINVIENLNTIIKDVDVNVTSCYKTSMLFKVKSNINEKRIAAAIKIIVSLEEKVKELEAVNERLKGEL